MRVCFEAEQRTIVNPSGLRKLRSNGNLPGIILNKQGKTSHIHIRTKEFQRWRRQGGSGLVDLSLGGTEKISVLLQAAQQDVVTKDYIHVDFLRIQHNETVKTKVPVEFIGTAAGVKFGGIVAVQSTGLEVEALPSQLPASLQLDISELEIGQSLSASAVILPEGVKLLAPEEEVLVSVLPPQLEEVKEEAEE